MGVFLQNALFPGCDETSARAAIEAAIKSTDLDITPEICRYAQSYEGTQVLIDGDSLGFAPFAEALSKAARNPVMLLYIYDDDFWGYDFYGGSEEDHFNTRPDYFGPVSEEEKQNLSGNPDVLAGWFPIQDTHLLGRYLLHWSDEDEDELEGAGVACSGDQFPYGDCWQMIDFAARLGFPWPFDEAEPAPPPVPSQPTLWEILEKNLPPLPREGASESTLLDKLPSALSPDYIRRLLEEDGVREFAFEEKSPGDIVMEVNKHRWSVQFPERNHLCQRLSVLAAFCAYWQGGSNVWGFLSEATYEPLYGNFPKPTDIYVLRARASVTEFAKWHRAIKDLKRLIELDPENRGLYQAEIRKWEDLERAWERRAVPQQNAVFNGFQEQKRLEAERDAQRIARILEKRRKRKDK
jgi:hypothetical protein